MPMNIEVGKKFIIIVEFELCSTILTIDLTVKSISTLTPAFIMQILVRESV
jgi:hypothetical protein